MSLTFYYAPMSTASITQLVIEELGVPCDKVKLDLSKSDTKKPDFLKVNPNAKVPVIVHDGTAIWESAAITMYLGETFGVDKGLYPATGPKRGEAMKWIVWGNVSLGGAIYRWALNSMSWVPADQHNAKAAEAGKAEMMNCLRILDQALAGKQFLVEDKYSLADTHLASLVDWLEHMQVDLGPYANLKAWHKRCTGRPAYARFASAQGN
jgi:glutathione S-transferase